MVLHPDKLSYEAGELSARGQTLTLFDSPEKFFETGTIERLLLREMDVILMRQDPPFDMAYIPQRTCLRWCLLNPSS